MIYTNDLPNDAIYRDFHTNYYDLNLHERLSYKAGTLFLWALHEDYRLRELTAAYITRDDQEEEWRAAHELVNTIVGHIPLAWSHPETTPTKLRWNICTGALCTKRQEDLATMPYKDYLNTPEWKKLRTIMLNKADNRCQICNRGDVTLHVHHRTYDRRGMEKHADLIVLCADCHAKFHDKLPNGGGE